MLDWHSCQIRYPLEIKILLLLFTYFPAVSEVNIILSEGLFSYVAAQIYYSPCILYSNRLQKHILTFLSTYPFYFTDYM